MVLELELVLHSRMALEPELVLRNHMLVCNQRLQVFREVASSCRRDMDRLECQQM